ncbi:septum site-determining protein MinC [Methylococcus sp. EFPC2]|uniref:septum site-determining protein MinC n=1 Tax=Methylococcus sp. EFPC2 TaxID=2812648 RepID=UPI001F087AAC|nr:septum site-determining protein MinC [Methylococcus sp. EFPC2]
MTSPYPETRPQIAQSQLFEIKGGTIHLPILKLFSDDADAVADQLRRKVEQAPEFFRNAPLVIDLHELDDPEVLVDFPHLIAVLREVGVAPVGVRGGSEPLQLAARNADLAVLAESKHEPAHQPSVASARASAAKAPEPAPSSRLIEQPVRSGQRIYAAGGDLVVLAQVSAGAEIMADGNIHVYGALRGRAMAGVQGNLNARIFCSDLQAELIAIGGHYKVSENLDESVRGRPVQIYFRDNSLIIGDL